MASTDDVFTLPLWWGQRQHTYEFRLVDGRTGLDRGAITPMRDSPPSLNHDATATISRRVSGLMLGAEDAERIRPLTDRVEITMVVAWPGGTGRWPLGRYVIADDVQALYSQGTIRPVTLLDEMLIVDQELEAGYDALGLPVDLAVARLLDGLPVGELVADGTDQISTNGWSAGSARGTALTELATIGGYLKPWFTHHGALRMLRAFEPATVQPAIDLDDPPRVVRDSIAVTSELPDAPNRWRVISNDLGGDIDTADTDEEVADPAPVVGVYDVPSSAPHSIAQRGFVIPTTVDAQVRTAEQAYVYARTLAVQSRTYQQVDLVTPADPRHDGWDVVKFDGLLWLETGWSMSLSPGGDMRHTLRRAYPATDEVDA